MHITTILRYHFTPERMAVIKNLVITNAAEDVVKNELYFPVGRNLNYCRNQHGVSLKN